MGQVDEITQQTLKHRICAALASAEKADENSMRAQTLRLVKCAMDDRDRQARGSGACSGCDETEITALLVTMLEQRERSALEYDANGRIADAERERDEMEVLLEFLPRPLKGDALDAAAEEIVAALGARKLTDVGKCMTALRSRYPGQIDASTAAKAVRRALS